MELIFDEAFRTPDDEDASFLFKAPVSLLESMGGAEGLDMQNVKYTHLHLYVPCRYRYGAPEDFRPDKAYMCLHFLELDPEDGLYTLRGQGEWIRDLDPGLVRDCMTAAMESRSQWVRRAAEEMLDILQHTDRTAAEDFS
jgi:hypothetical protein